MSLSVTGLSDENIESKKAECIVRLKIRENEVKNQIWQLMTKNDIDSIEAANEEVSKIFTDVDEMIIEFFDALQGKRSRRNSGAENDLIK